VKPQQGDRVPALVRRLDLPGMIAYAGATWDWHRLHYDHDYLTEHGLPAPVVDGQVFGALLVEAAQDWLGPRWRVSALTFRLTGMVLAGESVRCEGHVTGVDQSRVSLAMSVEVIDDSGGVVRTAVSPATLDLVARP